MSAFFQVLRTRIILLAWVPVFWLLTVRLQVLANLGVGAEYLALPLAGYLGWRYGRVALAVVGIGGLPFLITASHGQYQIGGRMDVFIVALVVSAIAAKGEDWPQWIPRITSRRQLYAALVALVFIVTWHGPNWGSFRVSVTGDLTWISCLLLLLAGFRRVPAWPLLAVLIGAGALGLVVEALVRIGSAGIHPGGAGGAVMGSRWELFAYVDYPIMLVTGILYYAAGRNYDQMLDTHRTGLGSWRAVAGIIVLVSVLAAGWGLDRALFPAGLTGAPGQHLHLFGEALLLPLAALWGGLWLRWMGVSLVAVIVAAFWFVSENLVPGFVGEWRGRFVIDLAQLVTVGVFGWVGVQMRSEAMGRPAGWRLARWVVFAGVTLALLDGFMRPEQVDSMADLWPMIGVFTAIMLVVIAIAWWRRRRGVPPRSYDGWIAILALVPLIQAAVENTTAQWEKFTQITGSGAGDALRSGELGPQLLALAVYGWFVATALRTVLRDAGQWWSDVLRVLHALARLLGLKSLVAKIERIRPPRATAGEVPAQGWRPTLIHVLGVVRWVLAVVAAISLAVVIYAVLQEM